MKKVHWKYTDIGRSRVKHAFINDSNFSACKHPNSSFPWFWKSDTHGLSQRKECKNCINIINKKSKSQ